MHAADGEKKRILLVDDEPHVTHVLSRRLQKLGYETRVARDGEEAIGLVAEYRPILILSDLQMPRMDGLTLAERLKAHEATASTPILMISGRGFLLDELRVRNTNISEVIEKPFGLEMVIQRIETLLHGGGGASEAA